VSGPGGAASPTLLTVRGRRLEVELDPPQDGRPTLVFLHEGLGSVGQWRDFPRALAEATGCGFLSYSRLGYGRSDPAEGPRAPSFMHDEARLWLPEVLDATGTRDVIFVGHSDGASIALIYAGSAPAPSPAPRGLLLEAPHVFVEEICVRSIARIAEEFHRGDLRRRLARHHHGNTDATFESWSEVWLRPEFRLWNIEEVLPRIRCPVLVVQGEDDEYGTRRQVESIEGGAGGEVEALVLPACGHVPHRDRREAVLEAMTRFVRRLA
jgi:pimeloyl-ACP methyl ester carboxylesterase